MFPNKKYSNGNCLEKLVVSTFELRVEFTTLFCYILVTYRFIAAVIQLKILVTILAS